MDYRIEFVRVEHVPDIAARAREAGVETRERARSSHVGLSRARSLSPPDEFGTRRRRAGLSPYELAERRGARFSRNRSRLVPHEETDTDGRRASKLRGGEKRSAEEKERGGSYRGNIARLW